MFETKTELADLQRLLDASFERSGERVGSIFNPRNRLSAAQLSGFKGVRLVAVASVNANRGSRVQHLGAVRDCGQLE